MFLFCFPLWQSLGVGRAVIHTVCRISGCPSHATPSGQKSYWKLGCRELTEPWVSTWVSTGNALAAVFCPESCAGTHSKQIQVLQREICASCKVRIQNLSQRRQRSCPRKILIPKASANMVWKIFLTSGLYHPSLQCRTSTQKRK